MNILTTKFPSKIRIEDKVYDIDADYRNCVTIMIACEDKSLSLQQKAYIIINRLFLQEPENFEEAYKKALLFLNCGEEDKDEEIDIKSISRKPNIRLYSFEKDSKYIFSAVDGVLRGKLSKGDFIHWWEFFSAFLDLPESCFFSKILYFRSQKRKGKLTKEEKKIYNDMRDIFELEPPKQADMTDEERKNYEEFLRLVQEGS